MKKLIVTLLLTAMTISVCTGFTAGAPTKAAPSGLAETFMTSITSVKKLKETGMALLKKEQEKPFTMYAPDGRTLTIKTGEVKSYENVGWYKEPVTVMYAADGRTLDVLVREIATYENVGWYIEPVTMMYAVDGRTLYVLNSEIEAYKNVGWYLSPADFPISDIPMVALTFDDGPSAQTARILDCLAAHNAKATFFVVGNCVTARPDVVKRAYEMGMEIGNHTMTHPNLKKLSAAGIKSELSRATNAIVSATGAAPTLLRPPYGSYNSTVSSVAGMPLILWSIDTLDWKTRNADNTVNVVLNEIKDGSIVLMHDLYSQTADAAVRLIPELIARGYRLVTVSELAQYKGTLLQNGKAYSTIKR